MAITQEHSARQDRDLDVLIVGAGPTGLTLAAQLRTFGIRFRLIDRAWDRGHESRALAVQARTLELLDSIGLAEPLVARGNPSARVVIHFEGRVAEMQLSEFGAVDTRFPFVLFVSQAETRQHSAHGGMLRPSKAPDSRRGDGPAPLPEPRKLPLIESCVKNGKTHLVHGRPDA